MKRLLIILFLFIGCSFPSGCSYLTPVINTVKPYIDMIKPTTDEKMETMARIVARSIKIETGHNDIKIKEIKNLLERINKGLKLNDDVITIPMIFDIPGLSEKNKDRIGIVIDIIALNYGNPIIKTPQEYKWILKLIGKVQEKL